MNTFLLKSRQQKENHRSVKSLKTFQKLIISDTLGNTMLYGEVGSNKYINTLGGSLLQYVDILI